MRPVDTVISCVFKLIGNAQQKKKAKKAEEEGKKRHRKIQTKNVKKRMKRNDKRYQHIDSYDRRPGFIKKLFPRKRPSAN